MTEQVTITKVEYEQLKKAESKLNQLEAAGVDNWEGYSIAVRPDDSEEESYEDIYGEKKEILP